MYSLSDGAWFSSFVAPLSNCCSFLHLIIAFKSFERIKNRENIFTFSYRTEISVYIVLNLNHFIFLSTFISGFGGYVHTCYKGKLYVARVYKWFCHPCSEHSAWQFCHLHTPPSTCIACLFLFSSLLHYIVLTKCLRWA